MRIYFTNSREIYAPETKRLLTKDNRYPPPCSSNSMPESVVPSQLNCAASVAGVEGPSFSSSRARSVPTPPSCEFCDMSVKFQTKRFDSPNLNHKHCKLNWLKCIPARGVDLPGWMRLRLNIAHRAIHRHRECDIQQGRRVGHGMIIVLVVNLERRVARLALPVADQLKGTRAGARLGAHLILEYVHVEIWGSWIFLRLPAQQCCQRRHIKLQQRAQRARLLTISVKELD